MAFSVGFATGPGGDFTLTPTQLAAYFDRIGYEPAERPCLDARTLCELHYRHNTTVPYENLDLAHPRFRTDSPEPIVLCIDRIFRKIVGGRRGGYCFESNLLFAAALRTCGFRMYIGSALFVRLPKDGDTPGSLRMLNHHGHVVHHVLLDDGTRWMADVGSYGSNPLYAMKVEDEPLLAPPEVAMLSSSRFRLRRGLAWTTQPLTAEAAVMQPHRCGWYLQQYEGSKGWADVSFFTIAEHAIGDLMSANFWFSTHPSSILRAKVLVARHTASGCMKLNGLTLTRLEGGVIVEELSLSDDEDLMRVLEDEFGLVPEPNGCTCDSSCHRTEAVGLDSTAMATLPCVGA